MDTSNCYEYFVNDFLGDYDDGWLAKLTAHYCLRNHTIPKRKEQSLWLDVCIVLHNIIELYGCDSLEIFYAIFPPQERWIT